MSNEIPDNSLVAEHDFGTGVIQVVKRGSCLHYILVKHGIGEMELGHEEIDILLRIMSGR